MALVPGIAQPGIIPPGSPRTALITVNGKVYDVYIYTYTPAGAKQYHNYNLDPTQIATIERLAGQVLQTLNPNALNNLQMIDDQGITVQGQPPAPLAPAAVPHWTQLTQSILQHARPAPGAPPAVPPPPGAAPPPPVAFQNLAALTTPCTQEVSAPELSMLLATPQAGQPLLVHIAKANPVHFPAAHSLAEKRALIALENGYAPPDSTSDYFKALNAKHPTSAQRQAAIAQARLPLSSRLPPNLHKAINSLYETSHQNPLTVAQNLHDELHNLLNSNLYYRQHLPDYYNLVASARGLEAQRQRLKPTAPAYPTFDLNTFNALWNKRPYQDGITGTTPADIDAQKFYEVEVRCLIEALALYADNDGRPLDLTKNDTRNVSFKVQAAKAAGSLAWDATKLTAKAAWGTAKLAGRGISWGLRRLGIL